MNCNEYRKRSYKELTYHSGRLLSQLFALLHAAWYVVWPNVVSKYIKLSRMLHHVAFHPQFV